MRAAPHDNSDALIAINKRLLLCQRQCGNYENIERPTALDFFDRHVQALACRDRAWRWRIARALLVRQAARWFAYEVLKCFRLTRYHGPRSAHETGPTRSPGFSAAQVIGFTVGDHLP